MKYEMFKNARQKANLTQAEVAEKVGITVRAYQYYEAGTRTPSIPNIIKIAKVLNISLEELLND